MPLGGVSEVLGTLETCPTHCLRDLYQPPLAGGWEMPPRITPAPVEG
jgi:hypothetical protein